MKNKTIILIAIIATGFLISCSDSFLEMTPKSIISNDQLLTPENAEGMVIATYAELGNDHYTAPNSLWPYADNTSGDSYKGGGGTGDIWEFNFMELFAFNTTDNPLVDQKWYRLYVGVGRANEALKVINQLSVEEYPEKTEREAEMRFLRAHHYFILKTMFKYIPWIDETVVGEAYGEVSNREFTDQELWDKIAAEFAFAASNLPETQSDKGRPNTYAAKAYLAKTKLYQAYEQGDDNSVTGINSSKLQEVVSLVDEVSAQYSLFTDFGYNFLWSHDDGSTESVFSIQRSVDDGTPKGRLDWGNMLNYPMNPEYGCCWFHIPTQNLVNSFKTDEKGLPQFDTFNDSDVLEGADFYNNSFDVRLDHTVAIPGHPWKYDPNFIYQKDWARATQIYGHFSSLKENQSPNCACFQKVPPFMASSKNTDIIRFADVLLWKAEALIELGRQDEALPIINEIRQRANNSTGMLKMNDGTPNSNYRMDIYKPGDNCDWTQEFARQALRWERRLEFAMEGIRFFDLVRWGIAGDYINNYFAEEKTKREYLKDGQFTEGKHEYFAIPQNQIDFSKGLYKQNHGW
ncbi:RagB/SusD family nutrient uptake outer membrane protein [Draconibacterium halophilum]|uniref:RagB/SusD family nutrient uptake outer membrane protein n=1 Tax=Draconibacterium halophilum TaxID=2706887 RepID=A0A6C0RH56_9BACT|nr:RagB/SusD family nutrient uptake outer membrane protein [Draconibacterium halophilum]QIA09162.1 RagB/SusD family nutrient uptake outer membrane protein [Draconibacterium halophilum]